MNKSIEKRAYEALIREMENEIKVVETQYEKEFARVCTLIRVIAKLAPNPLLIIQEVQDSLNSDGDIHNNLVQFYSENYEE